jgi:hypothetical protein
VSLDQFQTDCFETCVPDKKQKRKKLNKQDVSTNKLKGTYNQSHVGSAVHLIRNPFDNIVSNFHCDFKGRWHSGKSYHGQKFTKDAEGFHQYCELQNDIHYKSTKSLWPKHVWQLGRNIPCRDFFYQYIQWHNHAFDLVRAKSWPVHVMHYEDYADNFNSTILELLIFLDLKWSGAATEYHSGDYISYYTPKERMEITTFMESTASSTTWATVISRYDL